MSNENGQTSNPNIALYQQTAGEDYINDLIPAYALQQAEVLKEFRDKLQGFCSKINRLPAPESLDKTPDGKAWTILISHVETLLDEYFFGLWSTTDFKWSVVANEVVGSLVLEAVHPVTGLTLKRTGAAAIQIMVDKVPEHLQDNQGDSYEQKQEKKRQRNQWANNPDNKKASALDMGFPKLKAECLKNAAQSFGKLFGRDINRLKADDYKPLQKNAKASDAALKATQDAINKKNLKVEPK